MLSGHTSGDGDFSRKCERLLQRRVGATRVLLTTSCTAALEIAALLCNLEAGDQVILPSYTFVSTANAFRLCKARLRFVDIRPDTLNLDEGLIEENITDRTRVIVPVHYAGVACEMDAISKIATEHDLLIVEDAAQGVNARYRGAYEGTLGDYGAFSFHETKNFMCGEGGALVLKDEGKAERAEMIREDGTNRRQFFRNEVDSYTWTDTGSSYALPDLLAAFLYAQLLHMDQITSKRRQAFGHYREALDPLGTRGLIRLPHVPDDCETNYHMFYILVRDGATRAELIEYLKKRSILAVFHYVPLHTSPMGEGMGYRHGMLPVTENLSERLLRLPFYYEIQEQDIEDVVSAIYAFYSVDRS